MPSIHSTMGSLAIGAVILANPQHGAEYVASMTNAAKRVLEANGVKLVGVAEGREAVEKLRDRLAGLDGLMMVFLTGGTSSTAVALYATYRRPVILAATPWHNATASMMAARSRILFEFGGRIASAYIARDPSWRGLDKVLRGYRAALLLGKLKVVQVDVDEPSRDAKLFSERFGAQLVMVSKSETKRLLEEAEGGPRLPENLDPSGVQAEHIEKVVKLYVVAKRLVESFRANAFTVDCFPFIQSYRFTPCLTLSLLLNEGIAAACEADYRALALLALSHAIAGEPGWMANFVDYSGGVLTLAHCTIATRLTEYSTLLPHFETGSPYAVSGRLRPGVYTIAALSPDYSTLWLARGEILESGTLSGGRCRTQAKIRVDAAGLSDREVMESIVANHHVVMPGDHLEELAVAARYHGLRLAGPGARMLGA